MLVVGLIEVTAVDRRAEVDDGDDKIVRIQGSNSSFCCCGS
jgi:hypothetical protein